MVGGGARREAAFLLVAKFDLLGEEGEDGEETREGSAGFDVVEQLISVVVLVVVGISATRLRPSLRKDLHGAVDDDIE